jgi:hypothetical protein
MRSTLGRRPIAIDERSSSTLSAAGHQVSVAIQAQAPRDPHHASASGRTTKTSRGRGTATGMGNHAVASYTSRSRTHVVRDRSLSSTSTVWIGAMPAPARPRERQCGVLAGRRGSRDRRAPWRVPLALAKQRSRRLQPRDRWSCSRPAEWAMSAALGRWTSSLECAVGAAVVRPAEDAGRSDDLRLGGCQCLSTVRQRIGSARGLGEWS